MQTRTLLPCWRVPFASHSVNVPHPCPRQQPTCTVCCSWVMYALLRCEMTLTGSTLSAIEARLQRLGGRSAGLVQDIGAVPQPPASPATTGPQTALLTSALQRNCCPAKHAPHNGCPHSRRARKVPAFAWAGRHSSSTLHSGAAGNIRGFAAHKDNSAPFGLPHSHACPSAAPGSTQLAQPPPGTPPPAPAHQCLITRCSCIS